MARPRGSSCGSPESISARLRRSASPARRTTSCKCWTPTALAAWSNTSAYFNGNTVVVELIVAPNDTASRDRRGIRRGAARSRGRRHHLRPDGRPRAFDRAPRRAPPQLQHERAVLGRPHQHELVLPDRRPLRVERHRLHGRVQLSALDHGRFDRSSRSPGPVSGQLRDARVPERRGRKRLVDLASEQQHVDRPACVARAGPLRARDVASPPSAASRASPVSDPRPACSTSPTRRTRARS